VGALVLTGTETLVSYIPRLVCLLIDSGWLPLVAAEPSLVEPAIAEALRVTTPSPVMVRSVVATDSIGPVAVRAGDRVILATFAANRALGPFDPTTNSSATLRQLWFGAGSHFCLGAPLAMAQIRLVMDALLNAAPEGALRIVSRRAARGVLIPAYARVVIGR
jgi:cytochrome P450